jgi:hypothetical protein
VTSFVELELAGQVHSDGSEAHRTIFVNPDHVVVISAAQGRIGALGPGGHRRTVPPACRLFMADGAVSYDVLGHPSTVAALLAGQAPPAAPWASYGG